MLNPKYRERRKLKMKVMRERCAGAARRANFHGAWIRGFWQKLIIRLRLSIRPRADRRRRIFLEGFPRDSTRPHDSSDSRRLSRITLLPADGPVLERELYVSADFSPGSLSAFFCRSAPKLSKLARRNSFGEALLRPALLVLFSSIRSRSPIRQILFLCNYALSLFLAVAVVIVVVVRAKLFSPHEEFLSTSWKTISKSTFFRDYGLLNLRAFIRRVSSFVPQRFQDNRS